MPHRCLIWGEFVDIMKRVDSKHSFGKLESKKHIKYVEPIFDMRTNRIFGIKFRGLLENGEKHFDFRDSDEQMYYRIMDWLEEDDA